MRYIASFVFVIGLFISLPQVTNADFTINDFITTWDTENTGTSASNQITIPGTGSGYSYSIYWESLSSSTATGTIATSTSASQTITFPEAGEYKVAIKGTYPRIYFNNGGDKLKILTVEQWGDKAWTSMVSAFYGCANLTVPATDAPDLSGVTSLSGMFRGATSFNEPINHWNISSITDLSSIFFGASSFNQPLNNWNVSNVNTLLNTFYLASSFNQDISAWDVSKVTVLSNTFREALSFNQPLNSWDVSNVTAMDNTLRKTPFNQPLDNWNTSSLVGTFGLFQENTSFNQDINSWDVSKVISFQQNFLGATSFNQPLDNWNTASATIMQSMFNGATSFNQPLNNWNVSNVQDFSNLFRGATAFNQPLNLWDTSNATNTQSMFRNNAVFNQSLSNWDTGNVISMYKMFENATAFDQDLSSWNMTSIATSSTSFLNGLQDMFYNTTLSQSNLDSTLQSWAGQSLNSNVPFHLGLKTYSSTGQTALNTLRDTYNWIITEQYQAEYQEGDDYTLSGTTTQSPVSHGSTTTAVEVIPDERCEFINWSDNNTDNPRTDTLTDNLTISANVECRNPTSGNSASSRYQKLLEFGNTTEAEAIKDKYLNTHTNTIQTAIITITALTSNPVITNNPESRQQLISLLQQLVQILEKMRGE